MDGLALFDPSQDQHLEPLLLFVALVVLGLGLGRLIHWLFEGAVRPEPWDEQVAADLERDEARPLCHRCLEVHDPAAYFCPSCGAAVGTYTNWLPYPYVFSLGHMLRAGTDGEFNPTRLNVFGLFLLSLAEYSVFAPVYWVVLLWRLRHSNRGAPAPPSLPPAAARPEC